MASARSRTRVRESLLPPRYREPLRVAGGGMGEVYQAIDAELERPVAVKLLAAQYAAEVESRRRFNREGLAAARLSSGPNTITIYDVGEWQGRPYLVMAYLAGGSLAQRLQAEEAQPPTGIDPFPLTPWR
jgi:eukaryotic-like serine/threonine-protein kinase